MPTKLQDAILAVLPIALVYFGGWAYLSSYIRLFGIDPTQVSIPLTTVLVYAFNPLSSTAVLVFTGGALFEFAVMAAIYRGSDAQFGTFLYVTGAVFVVLLLFLVQKEAKLQAVALAETVWHGQHLQTQMVPRTEGATDTAYVNYETCRRDKRLQQVLGLGDQMLLLCRSELTPCSRGTLFVFAAAGAITETANLNHKNARKDDGCAPLNQ